MLEYFYPFSYFCIKTGNQRGNKLKLSLEMPKERRERAIISFRLERLRNPSNKYATN